MTQKITFHAYLTRLFQLLLALIPACTGVFALLNNLESSKQTLSGVIEPLLTMNHVDASFSHSWRAIHSPSLIKLAYFGMTCAESLVGLLAIIGIIKMLRAFNASQAEFSKQQAWARAACVWGFLVWGLGFYTIGGDFFLAWQNSDLGSLQSSGLNYVLMMAIPYFFFKAHEVSPTI